MIRSAVVVAIGLGAASPALSAEGPSFSCAAARTQVERAICADPTLAGLDLSLEGAFRQALADHRDGRQDLLDEQRRWGSGRGARCGLSADAPTSKAQTSCLVALYAARIAALTRPAPERPAPELATKRVQTLRVTPDGHMTRR